MLHQLKFRKRSKLAKFIQFAGYNLTLHLLFSISLLPRKYMLCSFVRRPTLNFCLINLLLLLTKNITFITLSKMETSTRERRRFLRGRRWNLKINRSWHFTKINFFSFGFGRHHCPRWPHLYFYLWVMYFIFSYCQIPTMEIPSWNFHGINQDSLISICGFHQCDPSKLITLIPGIFYILRELEHGINLVKLLS